MPTSAAVAAGGKGLPPYGAAFALVPKVLLGHTIPVPGAPILPYSTAWETARVVQIKRHVDTKVETVNFTEARNNLKAVLDRTEENADYTLIKRRDAADVVVMSLDAFNSLMETVHLLKSPANAAHLSRSIDQYRSGSTEERDLMRD